MISRSLIVALPCAVLLGASPSQAPQFERVYELGPEEGVFAYSRISPDGRYLAYASEMQTRRGLARTITVVDLQTKKVLFTEPGIDAYFSTDGERMIYLSAQGGSEVAIRHTRTGQITRGVAPVALGDYFSWGFRDGKHLIATINSRYYYLDGDMGVMPAGRVPACPDIGVGERPLLSRDGQRITTFVRGTVVIRNLTDCAYTFDTGIQGAKADFSWDGRYVAFHAPKATGRGYDIQVVDLQERTVRTVTSFPGSSYFPSWTRDGRLSFRYDGDDYHGFITARNVLTATPKPLPVTSRRIPERRGWSDVFPATALPAHSLNLVMVWGTWSAHSPDALADLQRARDHFAREAIDIGVMTATDPGSQPEDVARMLARHGIDLPRVPLAPERLSLTEAHNQVPATLLFRDGKLIDRRLGAQTFEQLRDWVAAVERGRPGGGVR